MKKQIQEPSENSSNYYERQRDRSISSIGKKKKQKVSSLSGYLKINSTSKNAKPKESNLDFIKNETFNIKYRQSKPYNLILPPSSVQKYKSEIKQKEEFREQQQILNKNNQDNLAGGQIFKQISSSQINSNNKLNNNFGEQTFEIKKVVEQQQPQAPQTKIDIVQISPVEQVIQVKPVNQVKQYKMQPKFQSLPEFEPKKSRVTITYQANQHNPNNQIQNSKIVRQYLKKQQNLESSRHSSVQNKNPFLRNDRQSLLISNNIHQNNLKKQQEQPYTPKYNYAIQNLSNNYSIQFKEENIKKPQQGIFVNKESFIPTDKRVRTTKLFKLNPNYSNVNMNNNYSNVNINPNFSNAIMTSEANNISYVIQEGNIEQKKTPFKIQINDLIIPQKQLSIRTEKKSQTISKKQEEKPLKQSFKILDEINNKQEGKRMKFNLPKSVAYEDAGITDAGCFGNALSNFCI